MVADNLKSQRSLFYSKQNTIVVISVWLLLHLLAIQGLSQTEVVSKDYERGVMIDGYKSGAWEYYDSTGVLELAINYTNSRLIYQKPDTSSYVIFKDGKWVEEKLDIYPQYIGSSYDFYTSINDNVFYPAQARYRDLVGEVMVSFEVDTLGQAGNYQVIKDIGGECGLEVVRVLKELPNYWLVATKKGERYNARFVISCNFGIILDGKPLKMKKKTRQRHEATEVPLAKKLSPFGYTIKKGFNRE